MNTELYSEKLVSVCRHLGWTAIGCISLYIIFGFVFVAFFTVIGFLAGIFVVADSEASQPAQDPQRQRMGQQ